MTLYYFLIKRILFLWGVCVWGADVGVGLRAASGESDIKFPFEQAVALPMTPLDEYVLSGLKAKGLSPTPLCFYPADFFRLDW